MSKRPQLQGVAWPWLEADMQHAVSFLLALFIPSRPARVVAEQLSWPAVSRSRGSDTARDKDWAWGDVGVRQSAGQSECSLLVTVG